MWLSKILEKENLYADRLVSILQHVNQSIPSLQSLWLRINLKFVKWQRIVEMEQILGRWTTAKITTQLRNGNLVTSMYVGKKSLNHPMNFFFKRRITCKFIELQLFSEQWSYRLKTFSYAWKLDTRRSCFSMETNKVALSNIKEVTDEFSTTAAVDKQMALQNQWIVKSWSPT